jgi:glutamate synthase domain-containing protein 3
LALVYDEDRNFISQGRYHSAFLQPETWEEIDEAGRRSIKEWVELHSSKTASARAQWVLAHWEVESRRFVRLVPKLQA